MKYFLGGYYIVMKSNPIVPGDRPLMNIRYKYNSWKFLEFTDDEGGRITEPGDTCLSRFPGNYSIVSIFPVVRPCMIGRYLNGCNPIDNHNRMRKSDITIEIYWVT